MDDLQLHDVLAVLDEDVDDQMMLPKEPSEFR